MTAAQLTRQQLSGINDPDKHRGLPSPRNADGAEGGFRDTLAFAIDHVDQAQKTADSQITAFVSGEQENLHEVMIAMNQAQLSFQFMVEVRNKMLESYQELSRMQV
jgi:flagellar hook-basal body complex protein FliE